MISACLNNRIIKKCAMGKNNTFAAILFTGAILAGLAVAAGAFAAHGLKGSLAPRMFEVFETAVRYQMYHALALVLVAALLAASRFSLQQRYLEIAALLFFIGIILFSGSLYLLVLTEARFGLITPAGGLAFIGGWIFIALAALKTRPE